MTGILTLVLPIMSPPMLVIFLPLHLPLFILPPVLLLVTVVLYPSPLPHSSPYT
jgi:hypothetical protein